MNGASIVLLGLLAAIAVCVVLGFLIALVVVIGIYAIFFGITLLLAFRLSRSHAGEAAGVPQQLALLEPGTVREVVGDDAGEGERVVLVWT